MQIILCCARERWYTSRLTVGQSSIEGLRAASTIPDLLSHISITKEKWDLNELHRPLFYRLDVSCHKYETCQLMMNYVNPRRSKGDNNDECLLLTFRSNWKQALAIVDMAHMAILHHLLRKHNLTENRWKSVCRLRRTWTEIQGNGNWNRYRFLDQTDWPSF